MKAFVNNLVANGKVAINELSDGKLLEVCTWINNEYRGGMEVVSNADWDSLFMPVLRERLPNCDLVTKPQAENFGAKGRVKHNIPMLSTDKAYELADIEKFVRSCFESAEKLGISTDDVEFRMTAKYDGIAGRYLSAAPQLITRGENGYGYDMSRLMEIGLKIIGEDSDCIGEVVIPKSYFLENLADKYALPRGLVAGASRSAVMGTEFNDDIVKVANDGALHLVRYDSAPATIVSGAELLANLDELEKEVSDRVDYYTDGVVIDVVNEEIKADLGMTTDYHKWQIAKKVAGETAQTEIESITYQIGRTGRCTPVLEIKPVQLSGALISRVTGHHAKMILDNNLGKGAVISIIRSGEVIPTFLETIQGVTPELPTACPCCGGKLEWTGAENRQDKPFLSCVSPDCSAQSATGIIHHFKTIKCDLFGAKSVERLVDAGFDSIKKIYGMSESDFTAIGFGNGQAANFVAELKRVIAEPLHDNLLLASLGIHALGRGSSTRLLEVRKINEIAERGMSESEIVSIDGFGKITSKSISTALTDKRELMQFLLGLGFNLIHTSDAPMVTVSAESKLAGLNVVFTGTMTTGKRSDMQDQAASQGAVVQKAVNGKTDLLVYGEKAGSKLASAQSKGINCMDEATYLATYF